MAAERTYEKIQEKKEKPMQPSIGLFIDKKTGETYPVLHQKYRPYSAKCRLTEECPYYEAIMQRPMPHHNEFLISFHPLSTY